MPLRIASRFSLPDEAVTQTFAILAKRGAGKSYTASVMCEEMLDAGHHPVVLDPLGVWWGLQSSADGKSKGHPIIVLGGDHGDVPLEPTAGETIADFVVDHAQPVVLDLSHFRKAGQVQFATAFAERLYQRNRDPLHLFVDEADMFAPQSSPRGHEARVLGAMEDLARRGRARGIGMTLVTQRSAVLNKNVLTQIEVLIAMRTTSPQDRKAIKAWVDVHGEEDEWKAMDNELPRLPIGTAYLWSPGWLDEFRVIEVRKRKTFDSSATPKVGQKRIEPKQRAQPDLDSLRDRIADTIERAKKDDPRELRKRIAELEREVRVLEEETPVRAEPEIQTVEVPVFPEPLKKEIRSMLTGLAMDTLDRATEFSQAVQQRIDNFDADFNLGLEILESLPLPAKEQKPTPSPSASKSRPQLQVVKEPESSGKDVPDDLTADTLGRAPRTLLETLISRQPMRTTKAQLSTLSGYKPRSSTFANALSTLRVNGLMVEEGKGKSALLSPSQEGIDLLGGSVPAPPSPQEVREGWLRSLPQAPEALLSVLIEVYPDAIDRETLAEQSDYSVTSSTFANALSTLRVNGLIEDLSDKSVKASESLF